MHNPEFGEAVRHAEAEAESDWLCAALKDAKPPDRIKLMSLRYRQDWGEQLKIEHTGGVNITYVNDWRGPTTDAPPGATDSQD